MSDTDTVAIAVGAVNDAPVNTVPSSQSTSEDVPLVFSVGSGNAISIADVDAGSGSFQVTLAATNGTVTLAGTAGLTFVTGDGTADAIVTFTGTAADVNAALNGLAFTPTANFSGAASLQVTTNDQGNTGGGGAKVDTDSIAVTVNAVNDAPVNGVPAAQFVNEDTTLVFSAANGNAVTVADVDAGGHPVRVTLAAANGTVTLAGTAGLTFSAGDGTADATVTFTGTVADVNAALDGLTFTPTANFSGSASLQVTTNDQGNTGSGGALVDTDTVAITVTAVNDAPVNAVPGAQTVGEDGLLVFSAANGNAIAVADLDAGGNPVRVTLAAADGTVTLAGTTGLTFGVGDGTADATVTFTGTIADVNAALDGLAFTPTANFNGSASLQVTTDDQGNTGSGGAKGDADTVAITVGAVNDAPVNGVPGAQSVSEDTSLVFSTASGNAISVADVDAASGPIEVTLAASNGTVTLAGTTGLTFSTGDGTADATVTFTGTLAAANTALNGLAFTPAANFTGAASLQISADDRGNTGSGGPQGDTETISITVNPANDAPVNAIPSPQSTGEDTAIVFSSGTGNAISVADVDADAGALEVTLSATNGTLTLAGTSGLTFGSGDGTADATVTFTGTVADVNAALDGSTFTPTANFNGAATLQLTTNDQGNTGGGGPRVDTDTVAITVTAVNDAPANTVPGSQSTNEETALVFSPANGNAISVADVDAASGSVRVTLTATNGTVTLAGTTGLTLSAGDGTADAALTFTGTVANVNAALDGLTFTPMANFSGAAGLQVGTTDQGNAGTGGPLGDADVVAINVGPVNDAPSAANDSYSVIEDGALSTDASNGIFANDVDADGDALSAMLVAGPTHGTLVMSAGGDFSYTPTANYNGPDSFTYRADDGSAVSGVVTVTINVIAVNDAPVGVGNGYATGEDEVLEVTALAGVLGNDSDLDADALSAVLTAGPSHGALTLNSDGSFQYTPHANYNGADFFSYVPSDGSTTGNLVSVSLSIASVNDAPIASSDDYSVDQGGVLTVNAVAGVLANDGDVEGDALSSLLVTGPVHGSLALNADGSFTYTPTPGFSGVDSFIYRASDGTDVCAPTVVSFDVSDIGIIGFAAATYAIDEGSGLAFVAVRRIGGLANTVQVAYSTAAGTATAGEDYFDTSGTLIFLPGEASKTISVPLIQDLLDEDDDTIVVSLAAPVGQASLGLAVSTLTLTDDDPLPTVSLVAVPAEERSGRVAFTVTLSAPSARSVSVDFATSNGSAAVPADFIAGGGTIVFLPGEISKTVDVQILVDHASERDETFVLTLSSPVNCTLNNPAATGGHLKRASVYRARPRKPPSGSEHVFGCPCQ